MSKLIQCPSCEVEFPLEDVIQLQNVHQLLNAVARYALEMGEDWRIGPGVEIMEAYEALLPGGE